MLDYVKQYRTNYTTIFWIEAGRKESLERDFVNLYHTLFGIQAAAGKEAVSVGNAVIGVKSWFSGRQGPWLIVFDGADTIENAQSREYIDTKHFIPNVAGLHVILTSRSSSAQDMTRLEGVEVGEMNEEQATELFYRNSELQRDDEGVEDEIKLIVNELGYLALAITLAATYVRRTRRLQSDIKQYLPEYRQRRRELLDRRPESLVHQYKESVLTTWETSYQAIYDQRPEAAFHMTMLSFLNFDDVFPQLFGIGQTESTRLTADGSAASSIRTANDLQIEEYFEILEKFSFVQWKKDQKSYAMHKLVHAWGYERLSEDVQATVGRVVLEAIMRAIKRCRNAPEDKLRFVPHVMANFATLCSARTVGNALEEGTLYELEMAGEFLRDIGRLKDGGEIAWFVLFSYSKLTSQLASGTPPPLCATSSRRNLRYF